VNDPFELLGVEPKFALDVTDLETRHRELSRVLHPDRHVGAPAAERRMACRARSRSTSLSGAARSGASREALLARRGVTIEEGREKPRDPMLLMSCSSSARASPTPGARANRAAIEAKFSELKARENDSLSALGSAFDAASAGTDRVVKEIGMLRFTRRLLDEAALALDELE
jgi:molecular chaperone HscB